MKKKWSLQIKQQEFTKRHFFTRLMKGHNSLYSPHNPVKSSSKVWWLRNKWLSLQQELKEMSPVFRRKSEVSVLMINAQGIMISVQGCDYFLSYNRIPWMQDAPIRSVLNVQMSGPEAIEWPDLDVDLEIDSLRHPERYPLVIKRNPMDFV